MRRRAQLDTTTKALRDGSSSERGVYAASSQMKPVAMGFAYADRIPTVKRRERRAPIVVVVPSCARVDLGCSPRLAHWRATGIIPPFICDWQLTYAHLRIPVRKMRP